MKTRQQMIDEIEAAQSASAGKKTRQQMIAELEAADRFSSGNAGSHQPSEQVVDNDKYSGIGSAAMGAAKGLTFGYAPQIAGLAGLVSGKGYIPTRDMVAGEINKAQQQNPKSFLAGELGSGLALAPVIPGGAALTEAKTMWQAIKGGAALGGLTGLLSNPGEETGQIDVLQPRKRLVTGGLGTLGGGVLSAAGKYLMDSAGISRLASELETAPDIVRDNLRKTLKDATSRIKKDVISKQEEELQKIIGGKTAKINPDILPDSVSEITGRPVFGKTKERIMAGTERTRSVPTTPIAERKIFDVAEEHQMPLMLSGKSPPDISVPAIKDEFVPFFIEGAGYVPAPSPGATMGRDITKNAPAIQLAQPKRVGSGLHTQEALPIQNIEQVKYNEPYADVPLSSIRRMMKTYGDLADFAERPSASDSFKASSAKFANARNVMRKKITDVAPGADDILKKQSDAYRVISDLENIGGGLRRPISEFKQSQMSDVEAALSAADRALGQDQLRSTGKMLKSAIDYNRPIDGNLGSVLRWAGEFAGRKIPGQSKWLGLGTEKGDAALKNAMKIVTMQRLRELDNTGNEVE